MARWPSLFPVWMLLLGLTFAAAQQLTTVFMNDTRLLYSGVNGNPGPAWGNPGLDPATYTLFNCNGGVLATTVQSASTTLIFTGTSVTINFLADHVGSTAQVFLDGNLAQEVNTLNANEEYYLCMTMPITLGNLVDGAHNLTVVKDVAAGYLYFHSFQFTESATLTATPAGIVATPTSTTSLTTASGVSGDVVTVYMNDSSLLYSGLSGYPGPSWGDPGLNAATYTQDACSGGVKATTVPLAAVTLIFTGSSVSVNFLLDHVGSTATVYLDGQMLPQVNTLNDADEYYLCVLQPLSSGSLSEGQHNVTVVKDTAAGLLYLHSFSYTQTASLLATSSSAAASASHSNSPSSTTDTSSYATELVSAASALQMSSTAGVIAIGIFFVRPYF